MSKCEFTSLDEIPNENDLKNIVSNFEYKRISKNDLPSPININGLSNKCNSFIAAASGSTDGIHYSIVGIRPDKGNLVDEHPFVFYYDYNDPSKNFGGIIHHGDWNERTTLLNQEQISALNASGLTANFTYKSIPFSGSGSLEDLRKNGMLEGLSDQFEILIKKREIAEKSPRKT